MSGNIRLLYRFNADVEAVHRDGDRVTLDVKDWKPIGFTLPAPAYADAIMALHGAGTTFGKLIETAAATGDPAKADAAIRYYAERFSRGRLLAWRLADDDGELARVDALAQNYLPQQNALPEGDLQLCRFAYLRRLEAGAVLESGLVRARVTLGERGLAALSQSLARTRPAALDEFAATMWRLGFFSVAGAPEAETRRCWEFHDLLMHEASRHNRDAATVGGTYRFDGKFPSLPARKPIPAGERIALPAIDPARVRQASDSVDAVQARRRSVRSYAEAPISLETLSEFLWRVCRTTAHIENKRQDIISRPYPAGGSINELEFYLAVRRCGGLKPAVYHYDSHGHALISLAQSDKVAAKIVDRSAAAMGLEPGAQQPDVTVVIASRFPRLSWKYEGMAYRASLMNAGVLFELMYLVATDMGLAPCANGTGDSRLLQEATGLDAFEEVAIAEFALGMPGAT